MEDEVSKHQIRGWRVVAAGSQGNGSHDGISFLTDTGIPMHAHAQEKLASMYDTWGKL